MNEIDQSKFNRLENQNERLKLKLKKICEKQYANFKKLTNCWKDIAAINIRQLEIMKSSYEKTGKILCEQATAK